MTQPRHAQFILGCHSLATLPRRRDAIKLVRKAWHLGIRQFDTAPAYSRGYSEILLGQSLHHEPTARLTSKVGIYPNPKTILPAALALPINAMRRPRTGKEEATQITLNSPEQYLHLNERSVESALAASLRRLQAKQIDAYLLHEINPFKIPDSWSTSLLKLQGDGQIKRIGYGGVFFSELLENQLPRWLSVLQFPYPLNDQNCTDKLKAWLEVNQDKEVRLFGLFRNGPNSEVIHQATTMLSHYPNLSLLFSCRSEQRLEANLKWLLEA